MNNRTPLSTPALSTPAHRAFVRDTHLEDINGLWKYYCRLMSQVISHDLESEVPPPISAMLNDDVDPPCITLK
eukprot:5586914-Prorocentrum_lima.AAC.1